MQLIQKPLNMKKNVKKIYNMDYTLEEKVNSKTKAQELLERLKRKEKKIKFYEQRINKNTIVYCKNKERLDDYERSYNNIKIW